MRPTLRSMRRPTLPIDPWPRASLGERMSVGFVLIVLLLVPFCAAGAACVVIAAAVLHVYRSYDVGAALRALIDRHAAGRAPPRGQASPEATRRA